MKALTRLFSAKTIQWLFSLILVLFITGEQIGLWPSSLLQRLEWLSYDQRVLATLSKQPEPNIVIIDIDEISLQQVGQWPWPRSKVAELLTVLFEHYQVQLVGLDVIFAEPESNLLAQQWQELRLSYPELPNRPPLHTGDDLLASVFRHYPVVSSFYFEQQQQALSSSGVLPSPLTLNNPSSSWQQLPLIKPSRYTSNHAGLQTNTQAGGYFDNPRVDRDGVFRRVPLIQAWQGQIYGSLSLAMLSSLLGQPPIQLDVFSAGGQLHLEGIDVGGFYLPTDPQGAALVPWLGHNHHFRYISAVDVLTGQTANEHLAGTIAFLGTSAPGLMDLRSTSVNAIYPGVEIHATLLAGMLQMNFRAEPGYSLAITVIGLLVIGSLMSFYYPRIRALQLIFLSILLTGAHLASNLYAWHQGLVLPLASGLLLILVMTGWHLTFNFWRESHAKRQVAEHFGLYIPPSLVKDIVASPTAQNMVGQEKELTVLFSDVRNFTAFSETVTPAELTDVMNRLLTPVTQAIHAHQGTIDKYMGDAVMAFWGAPLPNEQHAQSALMGALAMQVALTEINQSFQQEGKPALSMGIGVHTGLMNVGNMGSEFRMAYTVLGDNVNLGARLESLTKSYGVKILSSEASKALVPPELFLWRFIDYVRVKGREAPVQIYELVNLQEAASMLEQAQVASSEQATQLYQQGQFQQAYQAFKQHQGYWPHDELALLYQQRCQHYLAHPPAANWDGVFTHTNK